MFVRVGVLALMLSAVGACAPSQSTSVYASCGAPSACTGSTICVAPDAGANGTCLPPCTRNEECPRGATGDAIPACDTNGRCVLGCDRNLGTVCPTGMTCVASSATASTGRCQWP